MSSFGERLRQERVSRGMTIEQIASATGIGLDYLEALERSDFRALPGRAFGKLHIRAYAETLGFDPRAIIQQYDEEREACQGATEESPLPDAGPAAHAPIAGKGRKILIGPLALGMASLVILAGAAGVYGLFFRARAEAGVAEPMAPPAEAAPAPPDRVPPIVLPDPATAPPPTVVPKQAAVAKKAAVLRSAPLGVPEYGVGKRMEMRRLVSEENRFRSGEAALFSTRVVGGRSGGSIRHVWLHEGRVQQTIPLKLGGPDWRTHSRKTLYQTGAWAVEARDENGSVLARVDLVCEPAGS
ncbi:MAG: DUF2914 domain-containing protein [Candidatus Polarisedimenticolia bacterium]